MGQLGFESFSDSQEALRQFMENCEGLASKASVKVFKNGKVIYHDECDVYHRIETNYSAVNIGWNDENEDFIYYVTYRNDYQVFECHGRTLTIFAEDKKKQKIIIEITR